ncbi:MAG: bifunctional 3,4-dihydroxy-2-butanone-4-phosphate synthase/GTP cyclohydrolase II [Planctomycetes bacterium]|nr:bifunctional 3,4-dihydroxy-2-butanone-4-phosphate synthase/GTP cyclohydrolase II [Planctomycetota bacterium]
MAFSPIPEVLDEIRSGRMVILVDDEERENEGDVCLAAERATPEAINFMAREARGLICLALAPEVCDRLQLPPQVAENTSAFGTAFTVSVDAREGVTTGISAGDRATTILRAVSDGCRPEDLVRPGHVHPLRARDGGVLVRAGQTEGGVDLARLAGLKPAAVICEVMNEDGSMARMPDLEGFGARHGLRIASVADLIAYRRRTERHVERDTTVRLPTGLGEWELHVYRSRYDRPPHLVLCMGGVGRYDEAGRAAVVEEPVLVRIHSECLTGDVFGSLRCDCGAQLRDSMVLIAREGRGVVLYMRQEGRGIGLMNKLRAYHLQDQTGVDTVEANRRLGFKADLRDYGVGAQILHDLGLRKLRLLTNNPKKIVALEGFGLSISERVAIQVHPSPQNMDYLRTKRDKLGHLIEGV